MRFGHAGPDLLRHRLGLKRFDQQALVRLYFVRLYFVRLYFVQRYLVQLYLLQLYPVQTVPTRSKHRASSIRRVASCSTSPGKIRASAPLSEYTVIVTFLSVFFGLVLGVHPVELAVTSAVASVELRLDGRSLGTLRGEPWTRRDDPWGEVRNISTQRELLTRSEAKARPGHRRCLESSRQPARGRTRDRGIADTADPPQSIGSGSEADSL